jgi:hypothetical protein
LLVAGSLLSLIKGRFCSSRPMLYSVCSIFSRRSCRVGQEFVAASPLHDSVKMLFLKVHATERWFLRRFTQRPRVSALHWEIQGRVPLKIFVDSPHRARPF